MGKDPDHIGERSSMNGAWHFLLLFCAGLIPTFSEAQCPTVIATFPYIEGFETSPAWASAGTNNDWAWGTPSHPLINSAPEGTKAWCVGGLNGSFYSNNQQSWLESPCFDLSALTYPYISFWLYWETEPAYDGLGFQYSVNEGATWVNLGSNADNDCLNTNWFNTGNITALNLAAPKRGWSGSAQVGGCSTGEGSGGWVRSGHCLDGVPTGDPVKFRFVFGAGSICNTFDGIGMDEVYIGEAPANDPQITYTCAGNVVSFNNTATLCAPSSVWNFGDPASGANNSANGIASTHTYPAPGTYSVSLTMTGPCNAPATQTIDLVIPDLVLTSTDPDCAGDNGTATATVNGAPGPFQYAWLPGGETTQTIAGLAAGDYSVTVQATDMCAVQGTVQLTLGAAAITLTETHTDVTCAGLANGNATVTATGGSGAYLYSWAPSGGSAANATSLGPGVYTCTVNDGAGCEGDISVTITEPTALTLTASADTTICEGESFTLNAVAQGGQAPFTYNWSPDGPVIAPVATMTYTVSATDANGCISATAQVEVVVIPVVQPQLALDVDLGCAPLCVSFSDVSTVSGIRTWTFGDGNSAGDEATPVHCYTDPGTFDVTLTIVDQVGCEGSVTLLEAVNVEAVPVAAIGVTPSVAIIDDPIFQFIDLSTGATDRTWHFGDPSDSTSSANNVAFAFPSVGCYSVLLEVSNAGGCASSATVDVCVEDSYAFYAPNAFTANNDGFNDGFMVSTTVRNPAFFELKIFDRWGQTVATINKQLTPWSGDGVPLGVYVWQARLKDTEGQMHEHRGSVTLLR